MKHTAINHLLIAGIILPTLHASAVILFEDNFSQHPVDTKHQIFLQKGNIDDAHTNPGIWFKSKDGVIISSNKSSDPTFIPPENASEGAALRLGRAYGDKVFTNICLEKTWEKGTQYSLKVRARIANKWGEYKDGTEHGSIKAFVAGWSPKIIWFENITEEQIPSTHWHTITLNFNTDETPEIVGKPIFLRLFHHKANTEGYFLWTDYIQLESNKETHLESDQNVTLIPSSKPHAHYLAEQAAKEFNLTDEQKNEIYEQYLLAIQCKTEIDTLIRNGRADEAKAYSDLIKESIQDFMLGQIGTDQKAQLQLFNNKMALEITQ